MNRAFSREICAGGTSYFNQALTLKNRLGDAVQFVE
jgi:hypothetical protein